jgi:pyruvate/2-oxoglutarate dehydrogenase complex dihydrolipoamide acyltransferase (E2) component
MRRSITALSLTLLLLTAAPGPAAAKEAMMVAFDAPIAFDTPPGTDLLVGVTVTVLTDEGEVPVQGSPIVLVLTGRDGSETEARGIEDPAGSGHYALRIAVPPGGARQARVVMRGSSSEGGPSDLALWLTTDPFTFGGVTAETAQVAPPPAAAPTTRPLASAASQAAPAAAPAADPAAALAPAADGPADPAAGAPAAPTPTWWPPAIVLLALGLAVVVAIRRWAGRRDPEGA